MLPLLRRLAERRWKSAELVGSLSDEFGLTPEERTRRYESGPQPVMTKATYWGLHYLKRAGLATQIRLGEHEASETGRALLANPPERITQAFLAQRYPSFRASRAKTIIAVAGGSQTNRDDQLSVATPSEMADTTPDDAITAAVAAIEAKLRDDLLARLLTASPDFFERVVVDLLLAMGYGSDAADAGQTLGRGGDGGVDGVIREDRLGLDVIYIQAKRYAAERAIGPDALRSFSGALDEKGARKGVFITTSRFTGEAERYAAQHQTKRIVLLDGEQLAKLMIANGVGMREDRTIVLKRLDLDYFEPDTLA